MRILLLSALLIAVPLAAQQDVQESPQVFGETVDVLVVNIETVVTDKQGNRVPDLTREDFRLYVDGQEVSIDYFTEIRDGFAQHRPMLELSDGELEELPAPEPMATNYLVFVDDFFAIGAHRNLVLTGLAEQLSALGERDQVAVVSYDGERARMLVDWTGDTATIVEGLEAAKKRKAGGAKRRAEARMFGPGPGGRPIDAQIGAGLNASVGVTAATQIDAYFPLLARQVDRLVDATAATLRGSLPPPGRKVALLVAGGWASGPLIEMRPLAVGVGSEGKRMLDQQEDIRLASLWYRPLVDAANLLGYSLYPIDAPGSSWSGPGVDSAGVGSGVERNLEFTLKSLAAQTGGRPLLNGLRSKALEETIEDTRSYYWLGFSAEREGSGRLHDIDVVLVREDLRARSRESFVDMSRREEAARTVEAGLILGDSEDLGDLDVRFGLAVKGEQRRTVQVPMEISVPFDDLELLPVEGRLLTLFEISLGARDKRNVVSNIMTIPVSYELVEPPPPGSSAVYKLTATLRREKHEFVVTIRDTVGGGVYIRRLLFDPKAKVTAVVQAADL